MKIGKIILSGMGVILGVASTIEYGKEFITEIKNGKVDSKEKSKKDKKNKK